MECEVGYDFLDSIVYMLRKGASAKFLSGVSHSDHIGLGTIAEKGNIVLLLAPEHILYALRCGVIGQKFDELRLGSPEILFVFPERVVSIEEYVSEFAFKVHIDLFCFCGISWLDSSSVYSWLYRLYIYRLDLSDEHILVRTVITVYIYCGDSVYNLQSINDFAED